MRILLRLQAAWQELVDLVLEQIRRLALRAGFDRPDHLHHADGSIYMRRFWLIGDPADPRREQRLFSVRLHHIVTRDLDRHMHDHPWPFFSLVLRGAYAEARPVSRKPCFDGEHEASYTTIRLRGDLGYRRATDRHLITEVTPGGVWTLVVLGRIVHWRGFYTPMGKVYWRHYEDFKHAAQISERGTTGEWNDRENPFYERCSRCPAPGIAKLGNNYYCAACGYDVANWRPA